MWRRITYLTLHARGNTDALFEKISSVCTLLARGNCTVEGSVQETTSIGEGVMRRLTAPEE